MRGLTWYEKAAIALSAVFFIVCACLFFSQRGDDAPYRVVTARTAEETAQTQSAEEEWPESLLPGEQININTAPALDLCRLPQIGEKRAQAIVEWREEHGPFQNTQDLMEVSGIGEGIFEQIKDYITTE